MSIKLTQTNKDVFDCTLADLEKGQSAQVAKIVTSAAAAERLAELGLTVGAKVCVIRRAPLNDPVEISVRGYRLCLRKKTAEKIFLTDAFVSNVQVGVPTNALTAQNSSAPSEFQL